jgi:putative membrane protein
VRAPDLWSLGWTHWELTPGLDAVALLWMSIYVAASRRVRRGWPLVRTLSFAAGLLAALVATQSGYDAYDDWMLSAHMVQHLLLLEVAPLLLLGGQPAMLLLRAAAPSARPRLAHALLSLRPLTHPLTCLGIFFLVVVGAHTPAFFDATVHHPLLHDFEHVAFLAAGLFMWWPVLDGDPIPHRRLDGVRRLSYVMVAMLPMTLIGAYLNRAATVVYSVYVPPAHAFGFSAVADQQQAGAIMWVIGSMVMITAGIWQTMAALRAEERRLAQREHHLDGATTREMT